MKTINLIKNPQNLGKIRRIQPDSATRAKIAESSPICHSQSFSCHSERNKMKRRISKDLPSKCAEVSCDGFVGFRVRDCENRTNGSLSNRARRIPQIHARDKRAGFGMMFAIILTILVAGLGILGLKFSTQTLNTTTNEYIAIQLDLYANSTAELAILHIQRNGFICEENVDCDLGVSNLGGTGKRKDRTAPIEKYITYGPNSEYKFTYKMTPLDNYDKYDPTTYMQNDDLEACEATLKAQGGNQRCYNIKEETKNAFILDIAGSVTNPLTNQTLRVTKRQVIKP